MRKIDVRIILLIGGFLVCFSPIAYYKYFEHNRMVTCEPTSITRFERPDSDDVKKTGYKVYSYYFDYIPGYSAMSIVSDDIPEEFDYEIRLLTYEYVPEEYIPTIDFKLRREDTQAEVILRTSEDDPAPAPHIYASNKSHIESKRRLAVVFCQVLLALYAGIGFAIYKGWRPFVMREATVTDRRLCCVSLSLLFGMALLGAMLSSSVGSILWRFNSNNKANLKDYFIVVSIVAILSMASVLVAEAMGKRRTFKVPSISSGMLAFLSVAVIGVSFYMLRKEDSPRWGMLIICFLPIFLCLCLLVRLKNSALTKILMYLSYGFTIASAYLWTGTINLFGNLFNAHHAGAYTEPILGIMQGKPFTGGEEDLYGHYALFISPLLKIFGANSLVLSIIMGLFSMTTAALMIGFIHRAVSSDMIRMIATLAVANSWMGSNVYWQTAPHRWLFPAIILYLAQSWAKKEKLDLCHMLTGYIICIAALIWSNESGAVCGLAWAVYILLHEIDKEGFKFGGGVVLRGILQIGIFILEIITAFGVVELYNFMAAGCDKSGLLKVSKYMGVLADDSYMVDFHMTHWRWNWKEWILIMAISLGVATTVFVVTSLSGKRLETKTDVKVPVMAAVMSLGLFTFFVNRTIGGCGIVMPFFFMTIASVFEKAQKYCPVPVKQRQRQTKRYYGPTTSVMTMFVAISLVYFAVIILYLPSRVTEMAEAKINGVDMNYRALKEDLARFEEVVPAGTPFYDYETAIIALNFNRDMEGDEDSPYAVICGPMEPPYVAVDQAQVGEMSFILYYNPEKDR